MASGVGMVTGGKTQTKDQDKCIRQSPTYTDHRMQLDIPSERCAPKRWNKFNARLHHNMPLAETGNSDI